MPIEVPKLSPEAKRSYRHIALQEQAYMENFGPEPPEGKYVYYVGIVGFTPELKTRAEVEQYWRNVFGESASFDWEHLPLVQGREGLEVVEFVSGQRYGSTMIPPAQAAAVVIKESEIDIFNSVQAVLIKP